MPGQNCRRGECEVREKADNCDLVWEHCLSIHVCLMVAPVHT